MSTKLESLSAFESKSINQMEMSKIRGGMNAPGETGAGSRNIYDSCGAVVCVSHYTSDCNNGPGSNGVDMIDYNGVTATYPQ